MQPTTAFRRAHRLARSIAVLAMAAACAIPQAGAQGAVNPVVEALRERIEALNAGGTVTIEGEALYATRSLVPIYSGNGYQPLWDRARLQSLVEVLKDIEDDGLRPQDYHFAPLQKLMQRPSLPPLEAAKLDLLATDAYALILYHLYFGKVDPVSLDPNWNFGTREIKDLDVTAFVRDAIARNRVRSSVEAARPAHWMYQAGRESLAAYRNIAALGGWPRIPEGPAIKVGATDARVPLLRKRLAITGDLGAVGGASKPQTGVAEDLYDATLEAALKHAQRRYRLAPDGVLGPTTLRSLNVPVEQRIGQLRVNLERGRQVLHEIKDGPLVVVDIAGFDVRYLVDRKRVWQRRAMVGQPFRETPVFKAMIDNVVINPTWTVPPGILAKDIMPSLKRNDRSILARKKLSVIDRNGNITIGSKTYKAGDAKYSAIATNLSKDYLDNKLKSGSIAAAPSVTYTPPAAPVSVPSAPATETATPDAAAAAEVPLTEQPWFWPAVIGSTVVAGGAIWYFFLRSPAQPVPGPATA